MSPARPAAFKDPDRFLVEGDCPGAGAGMLVAHREAVSDDASAERIRPLSLHLQLEQPLEERAGEVRLPDPGVRAPPGCW